MLKQILSAKTAVGRYVSSPEMSAHHFNYDSWNGGILAAAAATAAAHRSFSASHSKRQRSMDIADIEMDACALCSHQ